MRFYIICLAVLIIVVSVFAGYQVAREKYERKGKWYAAELENLEHYEAGKEFVYGIRWTEYDNEEIVSIKAFIYDDSPLAEISVMTDNPTMVDGVEFWLQKNADTGSVTSSVAVPSENQPKTWPEAADRDIAIVLLY